MKFFSSSFFGKILNHKNKNNDIIQVIIDDHHNNSPTTSTKSNIINEKILLDFSKLQNANYSNGSNLEHTYRYIKNCSIDSPKSLNNYTFLEANIIDSNGNKNECIILHSDNNVIDEHIIDIEKTLTIIKNNTSEIYEAYDKKYKLLEKKFIEMKQQNEILQYELDKLRQEFLHMQGCC